MIDGVLVLAAGLSVFIALLNALEERRYDLAVMRVLERGTRYRVLFLFIESRKPRLAARTRAWPPARLSRARPRR